MIFVLARAATYSPLVIGLLLMFLPVRILSFGIRCISVPALPQPVPRFFINPFRWSATLVCVPPDHPRLIDTKALHDKV